MNKYNPDCKRIKLPSTQSKSELDIIRGGLRDI